MEKKDLLRNIPSVDTLLQTESLAKLAESSGREILLQTVRSVLDDVRTDIRAGVEVPEDKEGLKDFILNQIIARRAEAAIPSLRRAVNATGVIIHTGLGRAVLAEEAAAAVAEILGGYSNLAVDLETGRRGDRDNHLNGLICRLTGAEAATVVNNNAAATVLILNTLAKGKEVVISRGQLVEIGGSFRMPDVMETSGALLREVGTTNKTHLKDYEATTNERTGAILRVHHSNYRIVGFFEEPPLGDIIALGKAKGVPVVDDLGSGALVDLARFGLETEPLVRRSIEAGADVVCFSGDKLIGGPQSGIIAGRAEILAAIKKNPLKRAFRCGKMTIAALEATLKLFLDMDRLAERHPVYRMLAISLEDLDKRAHRMERRLNKILPPATEVRIEDGGSEVGSGSVPAQTLPTKLVAVRSSRIAPDGLARALRLNRPPIIARIWKDGVVFDVRTIRPEEDTTVLSALVRILAKV